jgi:carbon-monoxide dehydrogenase small subunit
VSAPLQIEVTVNGCSSVHQVEARYLLSDFLRDELGLTGTHVGCEHGVCGACTILVNGEAARSCLMFAVQADGVRIETIEGLTASGALQNLQSLFAEHHALQCGYCTPGMLIVAYDLLRHSGPLTPAEIREGMSATLCRCTGYDGIVQAVSKAAAARALPPSVERSEGRGDGSP